MNKSLIIIAVVVIILAIGGYFIFVKQGSAPTPTPTTNQPRQTGSTVYTNPTSFGPSFLQCSPSELKMPFQGNTNLVITVFGVENGKCHYTDKVVDQNGVAVQGGPPSSDCKVPIALVNSDLFGHLFGSDKTPAVKATQDKLQTDYCTIQ